MGILNRLSLLSVLPFFAGASASAAANLIGGPESGPTEGFTATSIRPVHTGAYTLLTGTRYDSSSTTGGGTRVIRWDLGSQVFTNLGILGGPAIGISYSVGNGVNSAGTAIGTVEKFQNLNKVGTFPVRWDANSTVPTELGLIGGPADNESTRGEPLAINASGSAVGWAYDYPQPNGTTIGARPILWRANTATPVVLPVPVGNGAGRAIGINDAGLIVGNVNAVGGTRVVIWDRDLATSELGTLGQSTSGAASASASIIAASGAIAGVSNAYSGQGVFLGRQAVRWMPGQITPTALAPLGVGLADGTFFTNISDMNEAGTVIGYARRYSTSTQTDLGLRPVVWDGGGTAIRILDTRGTDGMGSIQRAFPLSINSAGYIVGLLDRYSANHEYQGFSGVMWKPDGSVSDLAEFMDPASGWISCTNVSSIDDQFWVSGIGLFDPDGIGVGAPAYNRFFMLQVPEPALISFIYAASAACHRRRR